MPNKYYVILYRAMRNEMTFPVKAVNNEFNNQVQFAGGYPAIFGGTDTGNGLNATLTTEVNQESRGTLQLQVGAQLTSVLQSVVGGNNLFFYSTTNWQTTGQPWGQPTNGDEGEMSEVVTVSVDDFSSDDPPNEVLDKLIALSGAPGGSQNQLNEFLQSETAAAFVQFIYDNVSDEDGG